MPSNKSRIQKGFDILHPYLAGFLCQELNTEYGGSYWWQYVRLKLEDQKDDLPISGTYAELVDSLDIANCAFWIASGMRFSRRSSLLTIAHGRRN